MGHHWLTIGSLDLIHYPVPIGSTFQSHRSYFWISFQEMANGARPMIYPGMLAELAFLIKHGKLRVMLMCITSYDIVHLPTPLLLFSGFFSTSSVARGAEFSYNHTILDRTNNFYNIICDKIISING